MNRDYCCRIDSNFEINLNELWGNLYLHKLDRADIIALFKLHQRSFNDYLARSAKCYHCFLNILGVDLCARNLRLCTIVSIMQQT